MKKTITLAVASILALVILLTACGGTPALTAQQIMDNAFAKMAEVNTVTFEITENMDLAGTAITMIGSGFTEPPDKSYSTISMSFMGQDITTEALQLSPTEIYMKTGTDTSWTLAGADQTATSNDYMMFYAKADPDQAKQWYLNPTLQGTEAVDGVTCYKIAYSLDLSTAFSEILGSIGDFESLGMTITPGEATGMLYISTRDFLVLKNTLAITMAMELQGQSLDVSVDAVVSFSKFNEPVTFPTP
jgi:hypothetical protein